MNSFPLIRVKISNEYIMAVLFGVCLLYLIPSWMVDTGKLLGFTAVLSIGLIIDAAVNFLRYKRPVCSVSAAVTVGLLQAMTPEIPFWGGLIGVAVALILGKHVWGGTGKNPLNPAITGLLIICLLFPVKMPLFSTSYLLIPAAVFSIPFLIMRPFASIGYAAGMIVSLVLSGDLTAAGILTNGVIFFSCLVITDPVTSVNHPLLGSIGGLLAGFFPIWGFGTVFSLIAGILAFNIVSYIYDYFSTQAHKSFRILPVIGSIVPFSKDITEAYDMTEGERQETSGALDPAGEEILDGISRNKVFGCGGAAFTAANKIKAVTKSPAAQKHFIINSVECDPGLIHDKWLLKTYPDEIFKGILLISKLVSFTSITLAVKDPSGIKPPEYLKICRVPDYYPAGAERLLIRGVLKKSIPQDVIPANEGILVLNLQTVYAIFEAVYKDKAADSRYLTTADLYCGDFKVVRAKIGTRIHDVAERFYPRPGTVFKGGGIMQAKTALEEDTVTETVNFIGVGEFPRYKESPICSKCGFCSDNCPSGLKVRSIAELVDKGMLRATARFHAESCISCGSCSYVCLSGRNLSARVAKAKAYLKSLPD